VGWVEQDLNRHFRDLEMWLESRPECCECGEPIQEDYAYRLDEGLMCEECMECWLKDRRESID